MKSAPGTKWFWNCLGASVHLEILTSVFDLKYQTGHELMMLWWGHWSISTMTLLFWSLAFELRTRHWTWTFDLFSVLTCCYLSGVLEKTSFNRIRKTKYFRHTSKKQYRLLKTSCKQFNMRDGIPGIQNNHKVLRRQMYRASDWQ